MNFALAIFESKAGDARIAKKIDFLLLEATEAFLVQELDRRRAAAALIRAGPMD